MSVKQGDPRWTARIDESKGAEDPLGMTRVTNRLLGDLLPGITTISPRPRYIAHHLWALKDTDANDNPTSRTELLEGLYDRERILLLAGKYYAQSDDEKSHTGLVGSSTAGEILETDEDPIALDFSFYSNKGGSYDQNYVGPMATMGLVNTPTGSAYEQPTERGDPIADAYGELADEIGLRNLAQGEQISIDTLESIAPKLSPAAVSNPDSPDREPLRSLYLGRDPPEGYQQQAKTRRGTLTLLLHIAELEGDIVPLTTNSLVNACYYGSVMVDNNVIPANIPSGLKDTAARWKALRSHDYFSYALEAALASWLSYLQRTDEADASLAEFKQMMRSDATYQLMAEQIGVDTITADNPLSHIVGSLWPAATEDSISNPHPLPDVPMGHPGSEYTLDNKLQTAISNSHREMIHATWPLLLLSLALRYESPEGSDAMAWAWMQSHMQDDITPVRFRRHLKERLSEGISIGDFTEWVFDAYVINRANEIAAGKAKGDSASRGYFEETPTGWRYVRSHVPSHWGARFDSAVSVCRDLALLNPNDSQTDLTSAGRKLLAAAGEVKDND